MVEPGPRIRCSDDRVAVEVCDRTLKPDRGRVMLSHRRESAIADRKRSDRRPSRRRAKCKVDDIRLRPQREQIRLPLAKRRTDCVPLRRVDLVSRPRTMIGESG
jgi:hypothetical protein